MGKQSQQQPTTQTVKQQTIPDEFMPYLERTLQKAQDVTAQPYVPYQGQRLADFSPTTQQGLDLAQSSAGNWQGAINQSNGAIGQGQGALGQGLGALQQGQSTVGNALSWNPTTINSPMVKDYQAAALPGWDTSTASQYMNPYVNLVLQNQINDAQHNFQVDQIGRDDAAIKAKAFGGSGSYISNAVAQAANERNMNDLVAQGLSSAYDKAQGAYSADRGQNLSLEQSNLQALLGAQDLRSNMDFNTQVQNNTFGLDRANLGLQGASLLNGIGQTYNSIGGTYGNLANAYTNNANTTSSLTGQDIQRMLQAGSIVDQHNQQGLDLAYNDFTNQRDYNKNNLTWMSGLVNGSPLGATQTDQAYQVTNPYAQLLGAGIGAAGLAKNMSS